MNIRSLKQLIVSTGAAAMLSGFVSVAHATNTTNYDATITPIYGTAGNGSTGWTSSTDTTDGVTLALQAKVRDTGAINSNDAGTYTYDRGTDSSGLALWSVEYSIYDAAGLPAPGSQGGDTFEVIVNGNTSAGIFSESFNPLALNLGDGYGTPSTAAGAESFTFSSAYTEAQNSENIVFAGGNPLATGTYDIEIEAFNSVGAVINTADIKVNVVPDTTSTLALAALAFGSLIVLARRSRSVNAA